MLRKIPAILPGVHNDGHSVLPHVAQAGRSSRLLACSGQSREKNSDQHGNDAYNDEQFDEAESIESSMIIFARNSEIERFAGHSNPLYRKAPIPGRLRQFRIKGHPKYPVIVKISSGFPMMLVVKLLHLRRHISRSRR